MFARNHDYRYCCRNLNTLIPLYPYSYSLIVLPQDQYVFIYNAILEYIETGDGTVSPLDKKDNAVPQQNMNPDTTDTDKNTLENQFEVCRMFH